MSLLLWNCLCIKKKPLSEILRVFCKLQELVVKFEVNSLERPVCPSFLPHSLLLLLVDDPCCR